MTPEQSDILMALELEISRIPGATLDYRWDNSLGCDAKIWFILIERQFIWEAHDGLTCEDLGRAVHEINQYLKDNPCTS